MIKPVTFNARNIKKLVPFHIAEAKGINSDEAIHFFVSDIKLNAIKNRKYIPDVYYKAKAVLTPDFSLYLEADRDEWRRNVELNRKIGEWWQREGVTVIPSISWADETSFDFCFAGVGQGGIVAISSQGITRIDLFYRGVDEMVRRLRPKYIICYGTKVFLNYNVLYYQTFVEERFYGRSGQGWRRAKSTGR